MIMIRPILLYICFACSFYSACSPNKTTDSISENREDEQLSEEKQQIKAFWEAYRRAQKYRVEGNWEEAAKNYEKALELDGDHEDARFNLGNMYLELGQYKKAESCWLKIVEANPNSARARMQLGRLYLSYEIPEIFDIAKAKEAFTETFKINKVITAPSMLLGHVALLLGDNEAARDYFQSVTGSDIKNVEAYFLLGYIHWKKGDSDKARQMFEKAVTFSVPEKAIKEVLSEGDTKGGKSHKRPFDDSLFNEYFAGLDTIIADDLPEEMNERYRRMDKKLNEIKGQIHS